MSNRELILEVKGRFMMKLLFSPFRLGEITLRNRIVLGPYQYLLCNPGFQSDR